MRAASSLPGGPGLCPHPQLSRCSWDLPGAPGPSSQQLRDGDKSPPLCRCKDTAGFLEGAAEDCRGLPGTPGPRCLFGQRDVPGGRKPQLPGSHASRKAGNQKPRLPEAPSGGLVGPGSLWGTPLVLAWSSGRAIGWGEETGWSAARPGVSSNMGQLLKIAETTEVWGTEDCGSQESQDLNLWDVSGPSRLGAGRRP